MSLFTTNSMKTFGISAHKITHLLHSHPRQSTKIICYTHSTSPQPLIQQRTSHSSNTSKLSQTTSFLRNLDNGAEIYLVGTAHISKASIIETKRMIEIVKPDAVMIELCPQRAQRLKAGKSLNDIDFLRSAFNSFFTPNTNIGQQFFKISIQSFYRFLHSLGLDPGGEFKIAMELAEQHNAKIVYGDRDVQETLQRLAQTIKMEDILKMMFTNSGPQPPTDIMSHLFTNNNNNTNNTNTSNSTFEAQIEAMKTREMARQMSEYLRKINPEFTGALIDERDEIMTNNLRQLSGRVVGVVGLAHMDGIERLWNNSRVMGGNSKGNALPF